ncbi:MAG: PBSX family phage terminase large subunit [Clostridia bacterium]|nr:PBSX family phage terminase large subunit [Clostridia bacterium]
MKTNSGKSEQPASQNPKIGSVDGGTRMKQVMELLLAQPAGEKDIEKLSAVADVDAFKGESVDNFFIVNAALLESAKSGNITSIKEVRSIICDDAALIHKLELDNEKLAMEKKKNEPAPAAESGYRGLPADCVAPAFCEALFDIGEHAHHEYVFSGGRGSGKSTFISLAIIDRLMRDPTLHALAMRQVGATLRTSVYQQLLWAIGKLGLSAEFKCTVNPLQITRIETGQKIWFRGADDPDKIKSIKVPFGWIGVLWFEELDQFAGAEAVRKIEQSVIRGGDDAYIFKSFNPPRSAVNWANKYVTTPKEERLLCSSTYLDVPRRWLGNSFTEEAEFLKRANPDAYENEYLGVANGSGGSVFGNLELREITDDEIAAFDRIYCGVDWGWYPDPYAYSRVYYDPARLTLYVYDELRCLKKSNRETAQLLKSEHGVSEKQIVFCDSAEPKSVSEYKSCDIRAVPVKKYPGSVDYSMKWLQSLTSIVIDPKRCPAAAEEFSSYEYDRDRNGDILSGYPDKNNHSIDAVRYALDRVIAGSRVEVLK